MYFFEKEKINFDIDDRFSSHYNEIGHIKRVVHKDFQPKYKNASYYLCLAGLLMIIIIITYFTIFEQFQKKHTTNTSLW